MARDLVAITRRANALSTAAFREAYIPQDILVYTSKNAADATPAAPQQFLVDFRSSEELWSQDDEEGLALMRLIEETSGEDYRASSKGWNEDDKIVEMKEEDMRYLIVRPQSEVLAGPSQAETSSDAKPSVNTIAGFLSFMLTQEDGYNVIYVYEIHFHADYRGKGLGQHLFRIIEHIGKATGMEKSMLTVFRCNRTAREWYIKRDYEEDENSPRPRRLRSGKRVIADYLILRKWLSDAGSRPLNDKIKKRKRKGIS